MSNPDHSPDAEITGIHAHYLSQQMADLRSDVKQEVREVKQEVRDVKQDVRAISKQLVTVLIAGLVSAAGIVGTLVGVVITVLQRL